MRAILLLLWASLTPLVTACQSAPAAPTPPATLQVSAAHYDLAMNAAASALRDRGFVVDRFDARMGIVSAIPEGIPTSGEWWKGNRPNLSAWEAQANLQNLRHVPRITLTPTDAKKQDYTLRAEVTVERLDVPTQRVTAAFNTPVTELKEIPAHWHLHGHEMKNQAWLPTGHDRALENTLVSDVEKRLR